MNTGRAASSSKPDADVALLVAVALMLGAPIYLLTVALAAGGLAGLIPATPRRDVVLRTLVALGPLALVAGLQLKSGWTTTLIIADLLSACVALAASQMIAHVRRGRGPMHRAV
jgi:hypothetical protein